MRDVTYHLGEAETITVESDEGHFDLHVLTDSGTFIIGLHDVSEHLLAAVKPIADYWAEGLEAAREHGREARRAYDADAYALDDPKHPTYHDRMSAIHDQRADR